MAFYGTTKQLYQPLENHQQEEIYPITKVENIKVGYPACNEFSGISWDNALSDIFPQKVNISKKPTASFKILEGIEFDTLFESGSVQPALSSDTVILTTYGYATCKEIQITHNDIEEFQNSFPTEKQMKCEVIFFEDPTNNYQLRYNISPYYSSSTTYSGTWIANWYAFYNLGSPLQGKMSLKPSSATPLINNPEKFSILNDWSAPIYVTISWQHPTSHDDDIVFDVQEPAPEIPTSYGIATFDKAHNPTTRTKSFDQVHGMFDFYYDEDKRLKYIVGAETPLYIQQFNSLTPIARADFQIMEDTGSAIIYGVAKQNCSIEEQYQSKTDLIDYLQYLFMLKYIINLNS